MEKILYCKKKKCVFIQKDEFGILRCNKKVTVLNEKGKCISYTKPKPGYIVSSNGDLIQVGYD